ncbi:hypothetical protein MMC06_002310 [Schaereria dolodes]|nr:hypothetical protein [Schaereria dolodes]
MSAVFRIGGGRGNRHGGSSSGGGGGGGEEEGVGLMDGMAEDVMVDETDAPVLGDGLLEGSGAVGDITVGISIEPAAAIAAQLAALRASSGSSTALAVVPRSPPPPPPPIPTKVLAQRIIKNAFNFLASFAGNIGEGGAGVEVVPLKAFQDWWAKFERRVENDPGFLDRDGDG